MRYRLQVSGSTIVHEPVVLRKAAHVSFGNSVAPYKGSDLCQPRPLGNRFVHLDADTGRKICRHTIGRLSPTQNCAKSNSPLQPPPPPSFFYFFN